MTQRIPAEVFPPGDFIREELDERGWTQGDLADILGRPVQAVSEIVSAKKAITPETAQGLGEAFGTGPELWLSLESTYRLSLTRRVDSSVSRRAKLYDKAPIKAMTKRKWIRPSDDLDDLERQLVSFLKLPSIEDEARLPIAARKSTSYGETTPSETAWGFRAMQLAAGLRAATFRKAEFITGLDGLRQLAAREEDVRNVPHALADLGIRFVVVEHLPRMRLDGVAFWLDEQSPVIAVSLRYDRIDWFWFTLGHELWHIKNGDYWLLDNDLVGNKRGRTADKPPSERRADEMASQLLVPRDELENFIARVRPRYSKGRIIQFAERIGVHPGIVVGQLQYRQEIGYSHSREMLAKVRTMLTETALTDGWGCFPEVAA